MNEVPVTGVDVSNEMISMLQKAKPILVPSELALLRFSVIFETFINCGRSVSIYRSAACSTSCRWSVSLLPFTNAAHSPVYGFADNPAKTLPICRRAYPALVPVPRLKSGI